MTVHDSVEMCIAKDELHIIPEIKKLMVESYKHTSLPMDTSVDWSETSWGEQQKYES